MTRGERKQKMLRRIRRQEILSARRKIKRAMIKKGAYRGPSIRINERSHSQDPGFLMALVSMIMAARMRPPMKKGPGFVHQAK